ncbi:hypothetical protein SCP_1500370 [Sparassis crispa]|uniref:Uncharacterized protein n=1 Tax=Sparassis crispa TaxID=139825 RepID=A0A401H3L5_9APHY|nr:hypothetical protein SCP_1500370 [Sparassis crispa]GBE89035.1 hypothetical protein SCP_1500370 [Sparassis crispa]
MLPQNHSSVWVCPRFFGWPSDRTLVLLYAILLLILPARVAGLALSVISQAMPGLDSRTALLPVVAFECPTLPGKDTVSWIPGRLYLLHHRCTRVLRGWMKVARRSHTQSMAFTSLSVRYSPSIPRLYVSNEMSSQCDFSEEAHVLRAFDRAIAPASALLCPISRRFRTLCIYSGGGL